MRNWAIAVSALAGIGAGGIVMGMALEAPARAQPGSQRGGDLFCPEQMPDDTTSLNCRCTPEATATGSVWGTDIYSDDSFICPAARHAGLIGRDGGRVRVNATRGQQAYAGTLRNGVTSANWGSWRRSIAFTLDPNVPMINEASSECPTSAAGLGTTGATCDCPANADGVVWGSGPYTADSNVCAAARHAGVIGAGGGSIRFRIAAGRSSYAPSTRNGIATQRWASYPRSIVFER